MAKTGLATMLAAKYNSNGTITYTEGRSIGPAVSYSFDPDIDEDTPLWADGKIVEVDPGEMQSGTLALSTTSLDDDFSAWVLGLTSEEVTVWSGTPLQRTVTEYYYDDNAEPVVVGIGLIERHQINDANRYKTLIYSKCRPRIPADAADTYNGIIDWQIPEIEFRVERAEAASMPWKREAWHESANDAELYIKWVLGRIEFDNRVGYGRVGYMMVM